MLTEDQAELVCALRRCGWSATEERLRAELEVDVLPEIPDTVSRADDGVLHLDEAPSRCWCGEVDE